MPNKYPQRVRELLLTFVGNLKKREKTEMLLLSKKWGELSTGIERYIELLSQEPELTKDKLFRLGLYKDFLIVAQRETNQYAKFATDLITNEQLAYGKSALEYSEKAMGIYTSFQRLPIDAINNFIGMSQTGSPLYNLLEKSYPETVTRLTNTLLEANALGFNPRKTAKLMVGDMRGNLTRALRIARTEQNFTFRETLRLQYKYSGIVSKWEWLITSDDLTCEYCKSMSGKQFDLDTPQETHPNCRCSKIPILKEITPLIV